MRNQQGVINGPATSEERLVFLAQKRRFDQNVARFRSHIHSDVFELSSAGRRLDRSQLRIRSVCATNGDRSSWVIDAKAGIRIDFVVLLDDFSARALVFFF